MLFELLLTCAAFAADADKAGDDPPAKTEPVVAVKGPEPAGAGVGVDYQFESGASDSRGDLRVPAQQHRHHEREGISNDNGNGAAMGDLVVRPPRRCPRTALNPQNRSLLLGNDPRNSATRYFFLRTRSALASIFFLSAALSFP
jgi:hypothetical protein